MIKFDKAQLFLVTGANSGIGKGTALSLNKLGATVVAVGRNIERLKEMKEQAILPENIHLERRDLSKDINMLPQYVTLLKKKYGKFQGMAYCAGVAEIKPLKILDLSEMKALYDVNLYAPVFMAKGLGDRRNNVGKGTSMVFISSFAAIVPNKGQATYAGAKAGLCASAKSIARELAPQGVRVNCVLPSDIDTPMTNKSLAKKERFENYPMGIGEVSDVANMIVYLLSDKSKWITGQNYVVDCGSF